MSHSTGLAIEVGPGAALGVVLSAVLLGASAAPAAPSACAADCNSCHPASGSAGTQSDAGQPRWNAASRATASFLVYANVQVETGSPSRLCLSCHDGTVSRALHLPRIGADMDPAAGHPVGVQYAVATGLDSGPHSLRSPMSPSGLGGSIDEDLLVGGRLECTSCHERHQGPGRPHGVLRLATAGGRLCLTCHAK